MCLSRGLNENQTFAKNVYLYILLTFRFGKLKKTNCKLKLFDWKIESIRVFQCDFLALVA